MILIALVIIGVLTLALAISVALVAHDVALDQRRLAPTGGRAAQLTH